MLTSRSETGIECKKQESCTLSQDCLQQGDNKAMVLEEPEYACKADMDEGGGIGDGLDTKDIMENLATNGADDETTSNFINSIHGELDAPYKTYTGIACKKQARGTSEDCFRHGDNRTSVLEEPGHAYKADMREGGEIGDGLDTNYIRSNSASNGADDETTSNVFNSINGDILQCHIMSLLDARSLASCSAVCTRWHHLASADHLWKLFVQEILTKRPLLPLCIMYRDDASTISRFLIYSIAMVDSQQRELTLGEICGRTWEIRLKPTCGPYWLGFDPTQLGKPGLNRYFHCDGSLSSGPDDPIWGGQETVWKFVRVPGAASEEDDEQGVQINNWPPHRVRRLKDGLWVMENMYSFYITVCDNPAFSSSSRFLDKRIMKASCSSCSPSTYGFLPASHKSASCITLTSDK